MKTILLTGRNGQVGHELITSLAPLGRVIATGREQLDLAQPDSIVRCVRELRPDIIVNAAGYTSVDGAELAPDAAWQVNAVGPGVLAEQAKTVGALLVHFSTDYVFDGTSTQPYVETDQPNPVNAYGRSKLGGEDAVRASGCDHLILRASWIYSDRGRNFVRAILELARHPGPLPVVSDQIGSPCWSRSFARSTAEVITRYYKIQRPHNIFHFSSPDTVTRFDFAMAITELARVHLKSENFPGQVVPIKTQDYPLPGKRPLNISTSKSLLKQMFGLDLPPWRSQLSQFFNHIQT